VVKNLNFKKRIEELNTKLVLQETIIVMLIDDLKKTVTEISEDNNKKFKFLMNEIQYHKNELDTTFIQLKTFTSYQSGVKK